jgi:hypothetical protein
MLNTILKILSILVYVLCVIYAVGWGFIMRGKTQATGMTEKTYEINGLLMFVSLVLIPLLKISPFHLLWMFLLSFIMGFIGLMFPFNLLLWIPAGLYGSLWYIGLKRK